jgi:ribose transport system substrate-binding protein
MNMSIAGLGPHGEKAAPPERLMLTDSEAAAAREGRFTVAIVLHTMKSDWAKQQLAGIVTTLGRYSAAVIEVVDCAFKVDEQIEALTRLTREAPSAIISIPVGNIAVAEAHREVSRAGIKLVLMDNTPTGLLPGTDYACLVSADNFGLGQVAARLLSPHIRKGGAFGLLAYGADFFVANEREIAFRKWMESERPDVSLRQARFDSVEHAGAATRSLLLSDPNIDGMFAVWDEPAIQAVSVLRARSRVMPMTTIDLGNAAAIELAKGDIVKGIGAQQPYDQGVSVAAATVMSLIGKQPPAWIALPGLPVTTHNVIEAYQLVWHAPAPPGLIRMRRRPRAAHVQQYPSRGLCHSVTPARIALPDDERVCRHLQGARRHPACSDYCPCGDTSVHD